MRNLTLSLLVACGIGSSGVASAEAKKVETDGRGFSVLSGKTVGTDVTVVRAEVGFPGVSASLLRGINPRFDAGARITLNYAVEGQPSLPVPGLKLQAPLRFTLLDMERANLGLGVAPGVLLYFYSSSAIGITVPVSVVLGLPVSDAVSVHAAFEAPLWISFTPSRAVVLPILLGVGAELLLTQSLAFTFKIRMGPSIDFAAGNTRLALESNVGVALKL